MCGEGQAGHGGGCCWNLCPTQTPALLPAEAAQACCASQTLTCSRFPGNLVKTPFFSRPRVSHGCSNKGPPAGAPQATDVFSQFWRPEVPNQGATRPRLLLTTLGVGPCLLQLLVAPHVPWLVAAQPKSASVLTWLLLIVKSLLPRMRALRQHGEPPG